MKIFKLRHYRLECRGEGGVLSPTVICQIENFEGTGGKIR